jgi:hypothetical protein
VSLKKTLKLHYFCFTFACLPFEAALLCWLSRWMKERELVTGVCVVHGKAAL